MLVAPAEFTPDDLVVTFDRAITLDGSLDPLSFVLSFNGRLYEQQGAEAQISPTQLQIPFTEIDASPDPDQVAFTNIGDVVRGDPDGIPAAGSTIPVVEV